MKALQTPLCKLAFTMACLFSLWCANLSLAQNAPGSTLSVTTSSLPNGIVGTAYSSTLTASGGTPPYSWKGEKGPYPSGLYLSKGGEISGVPTTAGQFNFLVQVTDSSSPAQRVSVPLSMSISAGGPPLSVTTSSLPNGIVGTGYSSTLTASGGTPPYSWKGEKGPYPSGLYLSRSGVISGIPTGAGQFNFTIQVTDSSSPAQQVSVPLSMSITTSAGPTLSITTSSLPNGVVGKAYWSTMGASGGKAPYSWTITSGSLPANLSLGGNGTISGTPLGAGQSSFMVRVADSSSPVQQVSQQLGISVSAAGFAITGKINPNAQIGNAYTSTDQAGGGTPAYTWSISSGSLPPGLNLASTTGTISGTPSQNGQYSFTLKVVDSGSPAQSATQANTISVISGAGMWALKPTPVGWQFVAPDGGITCKYAAVSEVTDTQGAEGNNCPSYGGGTNCDTQLQNKYGGSWSNWANQQSDRLKDLGFTAAGTFSYRYGSQKGAGTLPLASVNNTSAYAMHTFNTHTGTQYYVKNVSWIPNPAGMVCGSGFYNGGSAWEMDPFDPTAQAAMNSEMSYWVGGSGTWYGPNAIIAVPEDGDEQFATDQRLYHGDGGLIILINNPMISKGKEGHVYGDATNFAKKELSNWLAAKYGSIAALNTAWGTNYTTFTTSDPGGLSGIQNGTYASWGTGTGLLDENGTHVISATQQTHCSGSGGNGISSQDNWATNPQIEADIHSWMQQDYAAGRGNLEKTSYHQACDPNCPPLFYPLYDGPTYIYAGMQSYVDGFWLGFGVEQSNETLAHDEGEVAAIAGATTAPLIVADYTQSTADSQIASHCSSCSSTFGWGCQKTQAAKASNMIAFWQDILPLTNANGKYAVVGIEHWSMYDSMSQCYGSGLFSINDNAYDGSQASTVNTASSWKASTSYTQPGIVTDGTHNYSLRVASGTSGASAPAWDPLYYDQTLDNSAKWFNVGSYPLIPEGTNFGNSVGPIRDFLSAGICDP